jgi:hypothetical protein
MPKVDLVTHDVMQTMSFIGCVSRMKSAEH